MFPAPWRPENRSSYVPSAASRTMTEPVDVLVIGGGPAGLTAGVFTSRADLDVLVADAGGSILQRNAHLENFPGFPAGVDARRLLGLLGEQAERAGAERRTAEIESLAVVDGRFEAGTAGGETVLADRAVCATKNEVGYLAGLDGVTIVERGKTFVETDRRGRTGVPGLYAAGRLAGKPHQAAVAAGHGAEVAVTLLEDADVPFYHDWVAPAGYFTGRGREVPPGCEEIDDDERLRREADSRELMAARLADPPEEAPVQHPSVASDE